MRREQRSRISSRLDVCDIKRRFSISRLSVANGRPARLVPRLPDMQKQDQELGNERFQQ